jgi:nicotinamide mononucleotide transporter
MISFFFAQYKDYSTFQIALEIIAVFFGLWSVWCAKKDNILVFPTGIVSTLIYTYLFYKWNLLGDMMINAYYVVMSIYGWVFWEKVNETIENPITTTTRCEKYICLIIFLTTIVFVASVYLFFNKFTHWTSYLDTFVTALFFVGMWLMAKRKLENWLLWIIGDAISIPMCFAKGYTFTSFQYLVFTIIAVFGFFEWKKIMHKSQLKD